MYPGTLGQSMPDRAAHVMVGSGEVVTYAQLDERSNRLAQLFRKAGLVRGDSIALLLENHPRFFEVCWAAQRSGLYYTAISSRLTPGEAAYIIDDSDARVFITQAAKAETATAVIDATPGVEVRLAMDGTIDGHEAYEEALASMTSEPIDDEAEGADMLYSSGTTGRPKGVKVPLRDVPVTAPSPVTILGQMLYGFNEESVYLSPAPLYHAAPLRFSMAMQRLGATVVIMERFDPIEMLRAIEEHRATHMQVVPTMFVRLLKLDPAERQRFDLSSLQTVIHAAAPCPIPVKEQMIQWWGPKIFEYYAGTEGNGLCAIDSEEWLAHKGSVGRPLLGEIQIMDDDEKMVGPGEVGTVYFASGSEFEYHKDPEKTAAARNAEGASTLGDVGYLDEEGFLYLTDRKSYMIISGGVNVYPQEAENALTMHPAVLDVAVIGVPDEDLGEAVKAIVQLVDTAAAGAELEQELIDHCRSQLAGYKCPRTVEFRDELPRHPTGKLYKRLLRDEFWPAARA